MKFSKAEIDAVIAASPRTTVPLNRLVLSEERQVRPQGSTPKLSTAELAASIKDSGVLQNLIVVKGARGLYEVCAGGRRLEALMVLAQADDIPENYPVPVLIVPADKALIASLAENVFHIPMHPADEYAAFAKLIGAGKSVEDVAAAFGVTPLVVKRRMKLAAVSPSLMAQFRDGQIGLDCLMVLASCDDHARQEQVWNGMPSWNRRPDYLRQLLTQGEIESDTDPVARYVTLKAYEKAGGTLRRDLFSDDDKKAYLLDTALLESLATAKLQKKAQQIAAQGWKWVEVRARYVFEEFVKYGELRKTRRAPSREEAAAIASLQARLETLHAQMDALQDREGDDENDDREFLKLEAEGEPLEAQLKALQEALCVWPSELMVQAGCVVFVGGKGTAEVKCGLVRPDDRNGVADVARKASEVDGDGESLVSLPSAKTRPVHSEKLTRRLTAHRVAAVQAELTARPAVALAALTAQLAQSIFRDDARGYHRPETVFAITAADSQSDLLTAAEDLQAGAAWASVQAERSSWAARLPQQMDQMFPWLLTQDRETVIQLLTFTVAMTVTGIYGTEPERQRTDALAAALGLDMSKWWSATSASYFSHVSKARILDVVTEAVDANAASPLAALKKSDAASGAEQTVATTGWLPACLRTRREAGMATEETLQDASERVESEALAA
ncbi:ParB/RepB/Spo0J family partition protein [Methylibium sp.]|uniref:ParB/RepB/Spo0J family partition protein n=1 Tax=Methylibium sp. TaxID=2067992 RepID=UPI003BA96FCC